MNNMDTPNENEEQQQLFTREEVLSLMEGYAMYVQMFHNNEQSHIRNAKNWLKDFEESLEETDNAHQ